ncbi:MAG: hypothetical protein C4524_02420 [Candidatus Zixiibacteriota bacterium]|nr:MAG: hypothetical protein C4524_02420 [candidate division Zixibacteria bacterium]
MVKLLLLLPAALLAASCLALPAASGDSPTPGDYEINYFVAAAEGSPQGIIGLDNNRALLWACREGRTAAELRTAGLAFTDSQLKLLVSWRLLIDDDGLYTTAFPILEAQTTPALRGRMRQAAAEMGPDLAPGIEAFTAELRRVGREGNAYTILFSYVLDDLVWEIWEMGGLLPDREITAETPFWAGVIWADYPPRAFSCGTNTISDQGVALKVNWSEPVIPKMLPFVSDWKHLGKLFDELVSTGRAVDPQARAVFEPFDLFDSQGLFTVPVIEEREDDPLYGRCLDLAREVGLGFPELVDLEALADSFAFNDPAEALVVAYHEFMWELLEVLEEQKLIAKPRAFADPAAAQPADIGQLVFIVYEAN